MKSTLFIVVVFAFLSCKRVDASRTEKEVKDYYLKSNLVNHQNSRFFKDYDIFKRSGVREIQGDTLTTPFFQVAASPDSILLLKLVTGARTEEFAVPLGNKIIAAFHDIGDGPRYIYSRIEKEEIIRYGYSSDPYKYEGKLMPENIEIIKRDTCYTFGPECLDTTEIKGKLLPFAGKIIRNCNQGLVQYFSRDSSDTNLYHYYQHIPDRETLSKKKPGNGIYGFKRKFKYWSDFHNLKRMI